MKPSWVLEENHKILRVGPFECHAYDGAWRIDVRGAWGTVHWTHNVSSVADENEAMRACENELSSTHGSLHAWLEYVGVAR